MGGRGCRERETGVNRCFTKADAVGKVEAEVSMVGHTCGTSTVEATV